jgi:hypothetical protein
MFLSILNFGLCQTMDYGINDVEYDFITLYYNLLGLGLLLNDSFSRVPRPFFRM